MEIVLRFASSYTNLLTMHSLRYYALTVVLCTHCDTKTCTHSCYKASSLHTLDEKYMQLTGDVPGTTYITCDEFLTACTESLIIIYNSVSTGW